MNVMVLLLGLTTSDPVTGPVAWPTSVASAGPMRAGVVKIEDARCSPAR